MPGTRYAILVGNQNFPKEQPSLPTLRCPLNDIERLGKILGFEAHGGYSVAKFPDRSHAEIKSGLYEALTNASPDDLILFYFSGHGKLDQDGNLYLVTSDTRVEALPPTSIALDDIRKYIEASQASQIVVILDCCFSGAVKKMYKGDVATQASQAIGAQQGSGTFYLTASTAVQLAEEKEGDDYSLLTKNIIRGIEEGLADTNDDGNITFQELCAYVQREVPREGKQKPKSWALDTAGEIVVAFSGKPAYETRRKAIAKKLYELSSQDLITSDAQVEVLSTIQRSPSDMLPSGQTVREATDSLYQKVSKTAEFTEEIYLYTKARKGGTHWKTRTRGLVEKLKALRMRRFAILPLFAALILISVYWRLSILDRVPFYFSQPIVVSVGAKGRPESVASGDFNGDHKVDLVAANGCVGGEKNSLDDVTVLLGNGDGTFQVPEHYQVGHCPYAVVIGDFNGDNKLDLAVSNAGTSELNQAHPEKSSVSILSGNGDGTFQTAHSYPAGINPTELVTGVFGNKGFADLVVASWFGGFNLLPGNGDGTFQPPKQYGTGMMTSWLRVGDFNGDHHPDIVVANTGSNYVTVFLGTGEGFRQAGTYPTENSKGPQKNGGWWGPYGLVVGDFNSDHKLDVAVSNHTDGNIGVLLGNGDGTFQEPRNFVTGGYPFGLAWADFNGDGKVDLVSANEDPHSGAGTVSVLLGNGDGTFREAQPYPSGNSSVSIALGDFNSDNKVDLGVGNRGDDAIRLLLNSVDRTTITLSSNIDPSNYSSEVTFKAMVTMDAPGPSISAGQVEFWGDNVLLGRCKVEDGIAHFSTTQLSPGFHTIVAIYKANSRFSSSTSKLTQEVQ